METTLKINGKEVVFETIEMVDKHGYENEWSAEGHTKINGEWVHTHNATASVTFFDEITDIYEIEEL